MPPREPVEERERIPPKQGPCAQVGRYRAPPEAAGQSAVGLPVRRLGASIAMAGEAPSTALLTATAGMGLAGSFERSVYLEDLTHAHQRSRTSPDAAGRQGRARDRHRR